MSISFIEPPFWSHDRDGRFGIGRQHVGLSLLTGPTSEPVTIAEVKAQLKLGVTAGEPAPTAPTVALPSTPVAGSCNNGAWRVGYVFGTADGVTELGPLSALVTIADLNTNGQIAVSNIALGGSVVLWRDAYAIPPSGGNPKFAGRLNNNTATTQTINIAASALGAEAPTVNTTDDPQLLSWITAARQILEIRLDRSFMPQTWVKTLSYSPYERRVITLPKPPLQVSPTPPIITYVDTGGAPQTLDAATYTVVAPTGPFAECGRILPVFDTYFWPFPPMVPVLNAFSVQFVAGYANAAAVPEYFKSKMKALIGNFHANRGDIETGQVVEDAILDSLDSFAPVELV